jgi:hypothetical protein
VDSPDRRSRAVRLADEGGQQPDGENDQDYRSE